MNCGNRYIKKRIVSSALLTLLLCGCAVTAPPISHIQLSAGEEEARSGAKNATFSSATTPAVLVATVALPDFLLRDELLLRKDAYSLSYDPTRRWAEPLDMGIQRVIARRLKKSLDSANIAIAPGIPIAGIPFGTLKVQVHHFEVADRMAVLDAEAIWLPPAKDAQQSTAPENVALSFRRDTSISGTNDAAIATALSELLWDFADALAQTIRSSEP